MFHVKSKLLFNDIQKQKKKYPTNRGSDVYAYIPLSAYSLLSPADYFIVDFIYLFFFLLRILYFNALSNRSACTLL